MTGSDVMEAGANAPVGIAGPEAILLERARLLAQAPMGEGEKSRTVDVVEFILAGERFGIETSCVCEVHPLRDLTPVPCTPPFVLGIINVHGQIISVVNLRLFIDFPGEPLSDLKMVIVLHDGGMKFGILADTVLGLRSIAPEALQNTLPSLSDIGAGFFKGLTADRTVILDGQALLSDKRIVVQEDVSGSIRAKRL